MTDTGNVAVWRDALGWHWSDADRGDRRGPFGAEGLAIASARAHFDDPYLRPVSSACPARFKYQAATAARMVRKAKQRRYRP